MNEDDLEMAIVKIVDWIKEYLEEYEQLIIQTSIPIDPTGEISTKKIEIFNDSYGLKFKVEGSILPMLNNLDRLEDQVALVVNWKSIKNEIIRIIEEEDARVKNEIREFVERRNKLMEMLPETFEV